MEGTSTDQQQEDKEEADKSKVLLSHIQSQSNPLSTLEKNHPTTDRVQALQADHLAKPEGARGTPTGLKGVIQSPLVPEVRLITTSSRQHIGFARQNLQQNAQFGVNSHSQLSTASNNILNIVQQSTPGLGSSQPEIFQMADVGFPNCLDETNTQIEFMRQNEEMVKIIQMCPFKNSREMLQNKQKRQLYDQIIGTPKKFNNKLIQIKNSIFQQRAEILQKKYENMDIHHLYRTQAEPAASLDLVSSFSGRKGNKKQVNRNLGASNFWSGTRAASAVGQTAVQRHIQPYQLDDPKMRTRQGVVAEAGRSTASRRRVQAIKSHSNATNDLVKAKMNKRAIIGHKIASSGQQRNGEILRQIREMELLQLGASNLSHRRNRQTVNNELTMTNMLDSNDNTISQVVGTDRLSEQREALSISGSQDVGQSHQIKVVDQNHHEARLTDVVNLAQPFGKAAGGLGAEASKHHHQTRDTETDTTPPISKLAANYQDQAGKAIDEKCQSQGRAQSKTMNRRRGPARRAQAVSQERMSGADQSPNQVLDPNWRFQQFNANNTYQTPTELQSDILASQGSGLQRKKMQKRRAKYTTTQCSKSKNILMFHNVEEMKQQHAIHYQHQVKHPRSNIQTDSQSREDIERPIQTRVVHQSGGGAIFTSKTQVSKLNKIGSQLEVQKRTTSGDRENRRRARLMPRNDETVGSLGPSNPNTVPRASPNNVGPAKNAEAMLKTSPLNNLLIQSVKPELISKYNAQVKQWTQAPTVSVGENLRIEPGGANMNMSEKQSPPNMLKNQRINSRSTKERKKISSPRSNMNLSFEKTQPLVNQGSHQQYLHMDPQKQATFQRFIQRFSNSLINEKKIKDERTRQINRMLENQVGASPGQNIRSSYNLPASAWTPGGQRPQAQGTAGQRHTHSPVTRIGQSRPFSQEVLPAYQPTHQSCNPTSYASQKSYVNDPSTQYDASPFNLHRIPVGKAQHHEVPAYNFNVHDLDPQLQDNGGLGRDESRPETILRQIEQYDYEKKRHESLAHIQQSINKQNTLLSKQRELSQQHALQKSDEELIQKNLLQLQSSVNENKTISLADGNAGFGDLVHEQRKLSDAEATFVRSTNSALHAVPNDSFEVNHPNMSRMGREILTIENVFNGAVSNSSDLRASYDAEPAQVQRKSRQQILINTPSNYLLQQAQSQHKEAQKQPPSQLKDNSPANTSQMAEEQSPTSAKQPDHTQRSNRQSQSANYKETGKFGPQNLRKSALMKKQPQLNKDLEVVSNESSKKVAAGSPKVANQQVREPEVQASSITASVIQSASKRKGEHRDASDNHLSLSADLTTTWRRKDAEITRTTVKNGGNHQSLEVRPGRLPNDSLVSSGRASSRSRNSKVPKQHSRASSFLTFDRLNDTHVYQPSAKFQNGTNESMMQESLVPMPIIIKTAAINEFGVARESATYDDNLQQIIDQHRRRINHVSLVDQQFGLIQIDSGTGICGAENLLLTSTYNMQSGDFAEQPENVIMMHNHNQNLIYIQKLQELQIEHLKERLRAQEKKSMKIKTFACPLPQLPDEQDPSNNVNPMHHRGPGADAQNVDAFSVLPPRSDIARKVANSRCKTKINHLQVTSQKILGEGERLQIQRPDTMSSQNLRQRLFSSRSRRQQVQGSTPNNMYQKGMQRPLSVTTRHAFPQQQVLTSLASAAGKRRPPPKNRQSNLHLIQSRDYVVVQDSKEDKAQRMVQQVAFDRYGNPKTQQVGVLIAQSAANVRGLNLKIQPRKQNHNFNEYTGLQKSLDDVDLVDTQRALQQDILISNHEMSLRNQNMQLCDTIPIQINSLHGSRQTSGQPSPGRPLTDSCSPISSKRREYVAIDLSMPDADLCETTNRSKASKGLPGSDRNGTNVTMD